MEAAWTSGRVLRGLGRIAGSTGAAGLLVAFLVLTRLQDTPVQTIRQIETMPPLAMPAPPPPPPPDFEEPPPPPPPALPKLDIQINSDAPALKAVVDQEIDFTMITSEFAVEIAPQPLAPVPTKQLTAPPRKVAVSSPSGPTSSPVTKASYSVGELDGTPRLLNSPDVAFPSTLLRQGVREGRAVLEVAISPSGSVSVRSILSCSHPEFATMARSFASRARFSVPRKNGRPVMAIYRWPLILRP